ncbi:MAG: MBL fold metallo-hydrolase [Ruminococcaceae bacterium]|nr:MBL fold metallo-hydrolase [Oscillospiraceae bacterium]
MAKRSSKKAPIISLLIIIVFVILWQGVTKFAPDTTVSSSSAPPAVSESLLTAEFLDVDQADCGLFYLPDGKILLIDGGDRGDGEEIVAYLKGKDIEKIDYLIATHPHADHIGGMSDIVDSFEIGKIFAPRVAENDVPTSKTYTEFLASVQKKGLKLTQAKPNTILFEGQDYKAECFAPNSADYKNLNDYSVTVKLSYGIHSFLLTGDAETVSEGEMLNAGFNLDSDVLKVGHHGSDSSSSLEFLNAVTPKYAVISCGEGNDYGHPHSETLERLENLEGIETVFRTDLDNTIIFTADGKTPDGIKFKANNPTVVD